MQFYTAVDPTSGHTAWVGTQAEARSINPQFTPVDVPTDKPGLLRFLIEAQAALNALAATPKNVEILPPEGPQAAICAPPPQPTYTELSIKIDEVFENLPLARQLHFAAIAMENARDRLKAA